MKVLLTIGCIDLLLPSADGRPTLLKALSKAVEVRDKRYSESGVIVQKPAEVKVEVLNDHVKIVWPQGEPKGKRGKQLCLEEPKAILL